MPEREQCQWQCAAERSAEDGDFLLDPAQWEDRLPQPFRTVSDLIERVLEEAWGTIKAREREQQNERLEVPELSQSRLLTAGEGVCAGEGDTVFVWGGGSVHVLEVGCDEELVQSEDVGVKEVSVGWCETGQKVMHVVAALTQEGEVMLFALMMSNQLQLLTRVSAQEGGKVVQAEVAHCCSHLALTCQTQGGVVLEAYELPVAAWLGEIESGLEEEENVGGSYSKPSLCLTLPYPEAAQSVFSGDPVSALQRASECCGTEQFHLLTGQYSEARRAVFLSQQADHTLEPNIQLGTEDFAPTYHFLLQQRQQDQLAVWWAGSTELLFYPLIDNPSKGQGRTPLHTLSQAATITATSVSAERRLMAVGLSSGTVGVWGIDNKQVMSVVSATVAPDVISALSFLPGLGGVSSLAVGTTQGCVMVTVEEEMLLRLEHGLPRQPSSAVTTLVVSSSLPQVVMSVHGSGDVVMWSLKQCQSLCKISLPSSWAMLHKAAYSSSGRYILLSGRASGQSEVFCVSLHGHPYLQPEWGFSLVPPCNQQLKCAMEKFAEACMVKHSQCHTTNMQWHRFTKELDSHTLK